MKFKSLFEKYDAIVFLDVETTGLNFEKDQIIQFAARKYFKKGGASEDYNVFVKLNDPEACLTDEIKTLTGITDMKLQEEGVSETSLAALLKKVLPHGFFRKEKILICAYNAQFDLAFLRSTMRRHPEYRMDLENYDFLDVLTVYRDRAYYPHKLCNAIEHYGVDAENSHQAQDDVLGMILVAESMEQEKDNLLSYVNKFSYKGKYGISGEPFRKVNYIPC